MRNHAVKTFSIAQTAEMWYLAFPMKPTIVRNGIVIVFCDPMYQALREKISGVYSAATKYGWQILPVSDSPTKESIVRQIGIWNPIGIIIDPIHSAEKIPAIPKCRTPIILMGRDNYRDRQIFDCSCQDTSLSVTAAINELNSTRTYASYAFIGHSSNAYWSRDRGTRFREGVKNLGCFHEYTGPSIETIEGVSALVDWMKRLPEAVRTLSGDRPSRHVRISCPAHGTHPHTARNRGNQCGQRYTHLPECDPKPDQRHGEFLQGWRKRY